MRATERILDTISGFFGLELPVPHWSTGRLWLLRIGLYKLQMPLEHADDWVWIVDHTNQVGVEKCFVVVGARLSMLNRGPLGHEDVETVALIPTVGSNGALVAEQLGATAARTGSPRQIVTDEGGDLVSGIAKFVKANPGTAHITDIKHKVATELRRILKGQPAWEAFTSQATKSGRQMQQSALAALRPPNQRSKARYMNLGPLINWGCGVLEVLDGRTAAGRTAVDTLGVDKQRLNEKLGWVRSHRKDLSVWRELFEVASISEESIRQRWHSQSTKAELDAALRGVATTPPAKLLRRRILEFVGTQSAKAKPNERLLGSSEVLESVFGRFKDFEGDQRRSGLTGSVLMIPAATGVLNEILAVDALEAVTTTEAQEWVRRNFGGTVQSKRRGIFSEIKKRIGTKLGQLLGTISGSAQRRQKE